MEHPSINSAENELALETDVVSNNVNPTQYGSDLVGFWFWKHEIRDAHIPSYQTEFHNSQTGGSRPIRQRNHATFARHGTTLVDGIFIDGKMPVEHLQRQEIERGNVQSTGLGCPSVRHRALRIPASGQVANLDLRTGQ